MSDEVRLLVVGRRGLFAGERFTVPLGAAVTVGRSRGCEISIANTRAFARIGRASLERNRSYRKISRRHFSLTFAARDRIILRDHSTNGTLVDGSRVREVTFTFDDLAARAVRIALGEGEEVVLSAGAAGVPDAPVADDVTILERREPSSTGCGSKS